MGTSPVAMPDFLLVPGQSPALVEVTSDPPGAAIYLDFHPTGEVTPAVIDVGEIGTFDSAGTLLASHVITLKRHGAPQPVPRTIAPVEAETIVEHFDLTDETSGAVLVETTPAGAEVFVDYADAPVGVTPVLVENLAPGFHTVLLRKEGYLRPRPVTARVLPHTGLAERSQANSFAAIGAAQGWQADDDCWGVVLPSRSRSMVSIEPTSLSTATGR
ncbi:MAG: PEGA domain-containing protein [Lentisphaerae bacterium]|nr:PEGA domain-containing protein [Lentisphaerota bacterium]